METLKYRIQDQAGIHARPAGILVKKASEFQSEITIEKQGKKADAKRILAVMGLGAKAGEEITITIEGPDEKEAAAAVLSVLEENL